MNYFELCLLGTTVVVTQAVLWGAIDAGWTGGPFLSRALRYAASGAAAFLIYVLIGFRIMYGFVDFDPAHLAIDSDLYTTDYAVQGSFAVSVACIFTALGARSASTRVIVLGCAAVAGVAYPAFAGLKWGRDAIPGFYDFAGGTLIYGFAASAGLTAAMLGREATPCPKRPKRLGLVLFAIGSSVVLSLSPYLSTAPSTDMRNGALSLTPLLILLACTLAGGTLWLLIQRVRRRSPWFALWTPIVLSPMLASNFDVLVPPYLILVSAFTVSGAALLVEKLHSRSLEQALAGALLLSSVIGSLANPLGDSLDNSSSTFFGQSLGSLIYLVGGAMTGALVTLASKLLGSRSVASV